MSLHRREGHEDRLAKLLAGSDDPRGTLAESELAECPECARTLQQLDELSERLERLGELERTGLKASRPKGVAMAGTRVRQALAAELEEQPAPIVLHREPKPMRWLAAAAILLALLVGAESVRRLVAGEDPSDATLGPEQEGRHPVGRVDTYSPLRWDEDLPEGGWFRVVVYDDVTRAKLFESDETTEHELWLTEAQESLLPDVIRWSVRIYDGSSWIGYVEASESRAQRP